MTELEKAKLWNICKNCKYFDMQWNHKNYDCITVTRSVYSADIRITKRSDSKQGYKTEAEQSKMTALPAKDGHSGGRSWQ